MFNWCGVHHLVPDMNIPATVITFAVTAHRPL